MRFFFLFLLISFNASAFQNETRLSNPEDEARAQELFHDIRCLVCQGESLAESNAELAVDMRKLIRNKIEAGQGEDEIKSYLTSRYGEQILQDPPVKNSTYLLWLTPFLIFLIGGLLILKSTRLKNIFK